MAETFHFEVVEPDRVLWHAAVESVVVTTQGAGEVGILAHHIPYIARVEPGFVDLVDEEGQRHIFAVSGGILSVGEEETNVLTRFARRPEEIDIEACRATVAQLHDQAVLLHVRANSPELLKSKPLSDAEFDVRRRYDRSLAQVRTYERLHGRETH